MCNCPNEHFGHNLLLADISIETPARHTHHWMIKGQHWFIFCPKEMVQVEHIKITAGSWHTEFIS
jgi:hypothetical protein